MLRVLSWRALPPVRCPPCVLCAHYANSRGQTFAVGYLIFGNTVVCTILVFVAEAVLSYCRWTLGMVSFAR